MSLRRTFRSAARDALLASVDLPDLKHLSAWAKNIDRDALPAFTVSTPGEQSRFADKTTLERRATVVVQLMRAGGDDLEDGFDDDADAIEAAVWPALWEHAFLAELQVTEAKVSGEGEKRLSVLTLSFECMYYTDLPED